jgi:hypothetical protein
MSKESDAFEQRIHRIHELIDGTDAEVTWNDRIPDPDNPKRSRQIDITIKRGATLTLVECRILGETGVIVHETDSISRGHGRDHHIRIRQTRHLPLHVFHSSANDRDRCSRVAITGNARSFTGAACP